MDGLKDELRISTAIAFNMALLLLFSHVLNFVPIKLFANSSKHGEARPSTSQQRSLRGIFLKL
jgi:hypothetical protein